MNSNKEYLTIEVKWEITKSAEFPLKTEVNGQMWIIRINDFPEEPMYTLIIDDQEIIHLDGWPSAWQKPDAEWTAMANNVLGKAKRAPED